MRTATMRKYRLPIKQGTNELAASKCHKSPLYVYSYDIDENKLFKKF